MYLMLPVWQMHFIRIETSVIGSNLSRKDSYQPQLLVINEEESHSRMNKLWQVRYPVST